MKKKILIIPILIIFSLIILVVINLFGTKKDKQYTSSIPSITSSSASESANSNTDSSKLVNLTFGGEFIFTDINWVHYDKDLQENVSIKFTKEGDYSFLCECGKPHENSNLYENFAFDSTKNTITLIGKNNRDTISLIYCDGLYLTLKFNDKGIITFKNNDEKIEEEKIPSQAEKYITTENKPYVTILTFENYEFKVAPYNYDGDEREKFADKIFNIKATKNLKFNEVTCIEENRKITVENKDISIKDAEELKDFYSPAYIEFADNGGINTVTFYGVISIQ